MAGFLGFGPAPSVDSVAARPLKKSTNLGEYPQALYIVRGTILGSYQGLQYYDVATDFGRVLCTALGNSRGLLGAQEASGYMPGEQVLVATSPAAPAQNSFIIGRADYARANAYQRPCPLLVYPQVAGLEDGARFSGLASTNFPRLRSFNSGILDAVDGEWVQHNMFGGAVGVEMWRTFLQAGPMAGIYAYTEDQHLKILAARYNLFTMHTSYETEQLANTGGEVRKVYFYLPDQQSHWQPQALQLDGLAYNGNNRYTTYPDGVNGADSHTPAPQEDEEGNPVDEDADPQYGQSRIALIHEHRGVGGDYVLSAASSLTLQKAANIPVPIDIVEADGYVAPDDEDVADEDTTTCCTTSDMTANPAPGGGVCSDDEDESDTVTGPRIDNYASSHPMAFLLNARKMVDRLIAGSIESTTGIRRWRVGSEPDAVLGGRTVDQLLFNQDPSMWKNMPQTFKLALAPTGESKRFYFGRAVITITEDGSIVLQDAHGSQISLSGGNIYLSANHDIVSVAGRNDLRVSGRDMALRSSRHLDMNANEGRLTAVAAEEATVVGGNSGHGGVLIESRGEHADSDTTGDTGENPATSGGIILKAKHQVGVAAPNISLRARQSGWSSLSDPGGHLWIDVGNTVEVRSGTGTYTARYSLGATMQMNLPDDVRIQLGGQTSVLFCNVHICKSLFAYKQFMHDKDSTDSHAYNGLKSEQDAISDMQDAMFDNELSPLKLESFKAKWLASENYNIVGEEFFQIPEPEWQQRAAAALPDQSSVLQSLMVDNTVDGTSPFPGNAAWTDYALAVTAEPTVEEGEEETEEPWYGNPNLSLTINSEPADGGLFKGI